MNVSLIAIIMSLFFASSSFAKDLRGRLGLGMSNQYVNGLPALSVKLQKSRSFAFAGMLAVNNDDVNGGHGYGVKFYKLLFDEPQLNFYTALLLALVSENKGVGIEDNSGFQTDLTLGSEFSFAGLESLGFSLEFGFSANSLGEDVVFKTAGYHVLTAGVHFYL